MIQESVDAGKVRKTFCAGRVKRSVAVRAEEHLVEEPACVLSAQSGREQIRGNSALIYEPVGILFVLLPFCFQISSTQERRSLFHVYEQLQKRQKALYRLFILTLIRRLGMAYRTDAVVPCRSCREVRHLCYLSSECPEALYPCLKYTVVRN